MGPAPGGVRQENESFARLCAYVATQVGVLVIRDQLKRGGLEASEPDPQDIDRTTDATADAIVRALGDAAVPWWGVLGASWGSLYLSMRIGAAKLPPAELPDGAPAAQAPASSPTSSPPPPQLGRGVPQQTRRPSRYQGLAEVPTAS